MNGYGEVASISANQGFAVAVGIVLVLSLIGLVGWVIKFLFREFAETNRKIVATLDRINEEMSEVSNQLRNNTGAINKVSTHLDNIGNRLYDDVEQFKFDHKEQQNKQEQTRSTVEKIETGMDKVSTQLRLISGGIQKKTITQQT